MFSVALSVGSPRLAVSEHAAWLESGLSSPEGAIAWRSPAASMVHDSPVSRKQELLLVTAQRRAMTAPVLIRLGAG